MVESGPAVMIKAVTMASTTPRASRRCAKLGDKLDRMNCRPSGTTLVVISIGAPFRQRPQRAARSHDRPLPFAAILPIGPAGYRNGSNKHFGRGLRTAT